MFDRLVEVRGQLAELVTAVDPDALSGQSARACWAEFDRIERLTVAGKTLLARRVADTHLPAHSGTKTAAEELARKAGTTTGTAKDTVNTSARLPEQPQLAGALRRGGLSLAQAALISAAAAANPDEEQRLVELAPRVSLAELREECARVRAAADPDPDASNRRLHAARALRQWIDAEGFWTLLAKGTPQAGAAFAAALQPIIDQLFNDARRAGNPEPVEAYAFDALMHLVEHATGRCDCTQGHGSDDDTGDAGAGGGADNNGADDARGRSADPATADAGNAVPAPAPGGPGIAAASRGAAGSSCAVRPRASTNPRYLALLRVDVTALRRGQVTGGELCEIAGVGPVPVSVARSVLSDAILRLVITNGVDVANVTHLGRGPTAAQRAALLWTNPTCSVQGCHRTRVENDHREPWAQTRHTRIDELDLLCEFHHDLKTRRGYTLVQGSGKRAFVPPDDPRHPGYRKPPADHSPSAGGPVGAERVPDRPRDGPADRPADRRAERTDGVVATDATTRWPRARPRARTAGQQPDFVVEPQPP
jgi:hypothetical protein